MSNRGKMIFALTFLLIGLVASLFGLQGLLKAQASKKWPSTPGEITVSEIDKKLRNGETPVSDIEYEASSWRRRRTLDRRYTHFARVHYNYKVNETSYEGKRIAFGSVGTSNPRDAQRILARYPKGQIVKVYYQPGKPNESLLEPGIKGSAFLLPILGGLFMAVGLFFGLLTRRKKA